MVNVRRVEMMVTRMLGYENGIAVVQHTNTSKTGKPEWSTRKCWFRRESSWASAALMLMALVLSYRTQCRVRSRAKRRLGMEWVSEASQSLSFGWVDNVVCGAAAEAAAVVGDGERRWNGKREKKPSFHYISAKGKRLLMFLLFSNA